MQNISNLPSYLKDSINSKAKHAPPRHSRGHVTLPTIDFHIYN